MTLATAILSNRLSHYKQPECLSINVSIPRPSHSNHVYFHPLSVLHCMSGCILHYVYVSVSSFFLGTKSHVQISLFSRSWLSPLCHARPCCARHFTYEVSRPLSKFSDGKTMASDISTVTPETDESNLTVCCYAHNNINKINRDVQTSFHLRST